MAISAAGREKEMKLQGKWKEEMRPYGTKKWCLDYCSIKTQGTNRMKWSFISSAAHAITCGWLLGLDFFFVWFFSFLFCFVCLFLGFYFALFLEKLSITRWEYLTDHLQVQRGTVDSPGYKSCKRRNQNHSTSVLLTKRALFENWLQ